VSLLLMTTNAAKQIVTRGADSGDAWGNTRQRTLEIAVMPFSMLKFENRLDVMRRHRCRGRDTMILAEHVKENPGTRPALVALRCATPAHRHVSRMPLRRQAAPDTRADGRQRHTSA
jgi:hypothetical protein